MSIALNSHHLPQAWALVDMILLPGPHIISTSVSSNPLNCLMLTRFMIHPPVILREAPISLDNNTSNIAVILANSIINSTTHPQIPLQDTVVLVVIIMILVRNHKRSVWSMGWQVTAMGPPPRPPAGNQNYGPQFQGANQQNSQAFFQYSQCNGKKKALCIGINYIGQKSELSGCISDANNIQRFLCRKPTNQITLAV